jgi:hypothetical protein
MFKTHLEQKKKKKKFHDMGPQSGHVPPPLVSKKFFHWKVLYYA